ncbi:MAG: TonB C-terminal domain-containing protein [Woeseiaceae bacterium]
MTLAALLHVLLLGATVFVYDFSRPRHPVVPLAISATLVTEEQLSQAPRAEETPPPVEPEPEPEVVPPPDPEIERRRQAEEQKRVDDLRAEQERIRREKEAEAERQRKAEEERRKREEAEQERRLAEAERKRQEDLERQRLENERLRKEAEEAERQRRLQAEIDAEEQRLAAVNASLEDRYVEAIRIHIQRNWAPPASARFGSQCEVIVRQVPGGEVVGVSILSCDGDEALRRSVEAAVFRASPLPDAPDPSVFDRNLRLILKTEQ